MLVHVPYSMPILRARQPRGGEVLQRLRRSIAPSTAPCIVRALRDGESGSGDRLLLVPRPVAGAQRRARSRLARRRSLHVFASRALSSDRRNSGSHGAFRRWLGACRRWLLHLPPTFARRRASAAGREQRSERARRSCRRRLHRPGCGGRRTEISRCPQQRRAHRPCDLATRHPACCPGACRGKPAARRPSAGKITGSESKRAGAASLGSVYRSGRGPWIVRDEIRSEKGNRNSCRRRGAYKTSPNDRRRQRRRARARAPPDMHRSARSPWAMRAKTHTEEGMT
jgi:hypothetical protein